MTCPKCSAPLLDGVAFCEACGAAIRSKIFQDPLLGKTLLQQYVIKRKLGEGGYGSVYLAEQPSMGRKVAIKTLHRRAPNSPDVTARFMREGIVACRLEHPNAIKMFNLGETEDGLLWIAMEFLEGKTLAEHLKENGPLSPMTLLELLGPVCEVLSEAHEKGIIHRDLKPENIMLVSQRGKLLPKVLDFGIAGILDDSSGPTTTGTITGTPPYMPPEQWSGLKYTDARSDIYALGVITYQCLSQKLPFEADTTPAWVLQHVNVPPRPLFSVIEPRGLPQKLEEVIMKTLAKSPSDRYQTVQDFYAALRDTLMYPNATTLPDASLRTLEQPPQKNNQPKWFAMGLGFSLLLLLVASFLIPNPQTTTPLAPAVISEPNTAPTTEAKLFPKTEPSIEPKIEPKTEPKIALKPDPKPTPGTKPKPDPNPTELPATTVEPPKTTVEKPATPTEKPGTPVSDSPKPADLTREERAIKAIQLYEEAVQMYSSKNYLEAQRLLEQAKSYDSGFPELLRVQGLLYLANNQAEKACVYFNQYLKAVPGSIYKRDIVLTMQFQNPNIAPSCTESVP